MRVVVFRSNRNSQWYFRVVAENGEIIAGSEGYKNRTDAASTAREVTGVEDVEYEDDDG